MTQSRNLRRQVLATFAREVVEHHAVECLDTRQPSEVHREGFATGCLITEGQEDVIDAFRSG